MFRLGNSTLAHHGQDLPVTSYALLGLLTFGDELTGYELKQRADRTLRFYWVAPAMSQVYSELTRLRRPGLVAPATTAPSGRTTSATGSPRRAGGGCSAWLADQPVGFPVLKHPVALRLLLGHLVDPEPTRALLEEYVAALAAAQPRPAGVRDSLRGRDAPGEPFRHPSLVADWGLAYFASDPG